ncbi:hypothetical protein BOTBODRAFT_564165 [Botryobasidium botryosum FD-172 SS1]|uniref:Uncharacterized protein n=1 Tax=Botryobasidium botryosum (strain FD-172 SS1) TaxID=930990 RepID=A0A067MAC2_BOTB1|nr:hypothetical protein BOTBODRAFT_564165 [Botryobasidium botryosum FD-172 SS1]
MGRRGNGAVACEEALIAAGHGWSGRWTPCQISCLCPDPMTLCSLVDALCAPICPTPRPRSPAVAGTSFPLLGRAWPRLPQHPFAPPSQRCCIAVRTGPPANANAVEINEPNEAAKGTGSLHSSCFTSAMICSALHDHRHLWHAAHVTRHRLLGSTLAINS